LNKLVSGIWQGIGWRIKMRVNLMKRINFRTIMVCFLSLLLLFFMLAVSVFSAENRKDLYSLEGISNIRQFHLSSAVSKLLKKNGFAVSPAYYKEISDIYVECKDKNQPMQFFIPAIYFLIIFCEF